MEARGQGQEQGLQERNSETSQCSSSRSDRVKEERFDYFKIYKCQFFLNIPDSTAILLGKLLNSEDDCIPDRFRYC